MRTHPREPTMPTGIFAIATVVFFVAVVADIVTTVANPRVCA